MKLNIDLFSSFIYQHFNYCVSIREFPNESRRADVIPVHRTIVIKLSIGQLLYFKTFQTFMRKLFIINVMSTSIVV